MIILIPAYEPDHQLITLVRNLQEAEPWISIVVVDDVITTGATAEACARALKRAGGARVDVLALARAVEPAAFLL